MFGPMLPNRRSRTDDDIMKAVDAWCTDPASAEVKYRQVSNWDTSRVTSMFNLMVIGLNLEVILTEDTFIMTSL
jgi:hypothetical protein